MQSLTTIVTVAETPSQKRRRIRRLLCNYAEFCEYYFPHFLSLRDKTTGEIVRVIHNAPFHNAAAARIKSSANLKAVFKWPRAHAKSTHINIFIPLWLMFQPQRLINFMVVVGKSEDAAVRLLSDIQAELEYNQRIIDDFGVQKISARGYKESSAQLQGLSSLRVGVDNRHAVCVSVRLVRTISPLTTLMMTSFAVTLSVSRR